MGVKILPGPKLGERTTLRLGGRAMAEVVLENEAGFTALPDALTKLGGKPMPLGWGSNILARDGELDVVIVSLPKSDQPKAAYERGDLVRVRAEAGLRLPRLLTWCAGKGLTGLEGLAGIPGDVGGAVVMNAGSYGCEVSQVLARALIFSPCCGLRWVDREDLLMGYRSFKPLTIDDYFIVVAAELDLHKSTETLVRRATEEIMTRKKAAQPIGSASAGCIFKNPSPDAPAGKLLDEAGFKGKSLGGMAFSEMHANFMINTGKGSPEEAFELIGQAVNKVEQMFGLSLEMEVRTV